MPAPSGPWQPAHAGTPLAALPPRQSFCPSAASSLSPAVAGRSFRYTEQGPEGLLGGKRVIIGLASGGVYEDGNPFEHTRSYLKAFFNFLGIEPDRERQRLERLLQRDADERMARDARQRRMARPGG